MKYFWAVLSVIVVLVAWSPVLLVDPTRRLSSPIMLYGMATAFLLWLLPLTFALAFAAYSTRRRAAGCGWLAVFGFLPIAVAAFLFVSGVGSTVPESHLYNGLIGAALFGLQLVLAVSWLRKRGDTARNLYYRSLARPLLVLSLALIVPAIVYSVIQAREDRIDAVAEVDRQAWAAELLDYMGYQSYPGSVVTEEHLGNYPHNYTLLVATDAEPADVYEFHRAGSSQAGHEVFIYEPVNQYSLSGPRFASWSHERNCLLEIFKWGETYTVSLTVDNPRVIRYWKKNMVDYQGAGGS